MREIKFRGISKMEIEGVTKKEDWVYGNLIENNGSPYIVGDVMDADEENILFEFWIPVKPDSVGQYTGLLDKNGKEIYEGDIVEYLPLSSSAIDRGFVVYYNDGFYIQSKSKMKRLYEEVFGTTKILGNIYSNIYSNPELLK